MKRRIKNKLRNLEAKKIEKYFKDLGFTAKIKSCGGYFLFDFRDGYYNFYIYLKEIPHLVLGWWGNLHIKTALFAELDCFVCKFKPTQVEIVWDDEKSMIKDLNKWKDLNSFNENMCKIYDRTQKEIDSEREFYKEMISTNSLGYETWVKCQKLVEKHKKYVLRLKETFFFRHYHDVVLKDNTPIEVINELEQTDFIHVCWQSR
jgi:hypothetical protein